MVETACNAPRRVARQASAEQSTDSVARQACAKGLVRLERDIVFDAVGNKCDLRIERGQTK